MRLQRRCLLVVMLLGWVWGNGPVCQAAVLANYSFGGTELFKSTDFETNSTAGDFVLVGAPGRSSTKADVYIATSATGADEAAALADSDYCAFTVVADPGMALSLSSLDFDFGYYNSTSTVLNSSVYVQSSVDGLGTGGDVLGTYTVSSPPSGYHVYPFSLDLSAPKFHDLSEITLRFSYSDNASEAAHIISDRLDNVVLNGTVVLDDAVVPEPSTALVALILSGFGLLLTRRGRQR